MDYRVSDLLLGGDLHTTFFERVGSRRSHTAVRAPASLVDSSAVSSTCTSRTAGLGGRLENYIGHGFVCGPNDANRDYPLDERRELVIQRCRVRAPALPDELDRFPFGDRLSLRQHLAPGSSGHPVKDPEALIQVKPRALFRVVQQGRLLADGGEFVLDHPVGHAL
jgi:hypothetical protein